jgi:hypothetical protein
MRAFRAPAEGTAQARSCRPRLLSRRSAPRSRCQQGPSGPRRNGRRRLGYPAGGEARLPGVAARVLHRTTRWIRDKGRRPAPYRPGPLCHPGRNRPSYTLPSGSPALPGPGMTGFPAVNGADRPTPAVPDGAVRPLLPASGRAQAGVYCSATWRDCGPRADMGSMRRIRSGHICASEVPRGRCAPLAVSAGCLDQIGHW